MTLVLYKKDIKFYKKIHNNYEIIYILYGKQVQNNITEISKITLNSYMKYVI